MGLLPVLLLFGGLIGLSIVRKRRPRLSWTVGLMASLLAWTAALGLLFALPSRTNVSIWRPSALFGAQIGFLLDRMSWEFLMGIVTLLVAAVLEELASPSDEMPHVRIFALFYASAAALVVLAGNLLTVVICLALVDVACFLHAIATRGREPLVVGHAVSHLATNGAGVLLILVASLLREQSSTGLAGASIRATWADGALLLGCLLRLVLAPMSQPSLAREKGGKAVDALLRLLPPAMALSVLARQAALPSAWRPWYMGVGLALLLAGGLACMLGGKERRAACLVFGLGGVGLLGAGISHADAASSLAAAAVCILLAGGLTILGDIYAAWHRAFPLLAGVIVAGFPFGAGSSIGNALGQGILAPQTRLLAGVGILGLALLSAELLIGVGGAKEKWRVMEDARRIAYGLGMLLLALLGTSLGIRQPRTLAGGLIFLIVLAVGFGFSRLRLRLPIEEISTRLQGAWRWLDLAPMGGALNRIGSGVLRYVRATGRILEGEGGMLWVIVILMAIQLVLLGHTP
jgi:hypothetical protein